MGFSEFGRRVAENASGGTDHGQAGPLMLIGDAVVPGLSGTHPPLDTLENGDLRYQIDFRQVYATVLRELLHADADRLLGRRWATPSPPRLCVPCCTHLPVFTAVFSSASPSRTLWQQGFSM